MLWRIGFGEDTIPDVSNFFRIGEYRDIEIMVPKPGFIGSPPSASAHPPRKAVPSSNEDFLYKYVRITVIKKINLKKGNRIVFKLDEIDPNGTFVTYYESGGGDGYHEPIYYAYLDLKPTGCKMIGTVRAIPETRNNKQQEELVHGILNRCTRSGIEFPLTFTFPPVFNPHENFKDNSWMHGDYAIVYTGATKRDAPYYRRINSSLLRKVEPSMEIKEENIRYYSDNDKILSETKKAGSVSVIISTKETQIWEKSSAWLWSELERTDNDGNLIMRCRKMK